MYFTVSLLFDYLSVTLSLRFNNCNSGLNNKVIWGAEAICIVVLTVEGLVLMSFNVNCNSGLDNKVIGGMND